MSYLEFVLASGNDRLCELLESVPAEDHINPKIHTKCLDYIIQHGTGIFPVEIKAGAKGAMKSLHQLIFDKKLPLAVRCDTNPISAGQMQVKTTLGDEVSYTLLSVPLYMVELLPRLLDGIIS